MVFYENKKINGLFANGPINRNVYVSVSDMGWKKPWDGSDCQTEAMMIMAAHAKEQDSTVSFEEENGKIKILYVF